MGSELSGSDWEQKDRGRMEILSGRYISADSMDGEHFNAEVGKGPFYFFCDRCFSCSCFPPFSNLQLRDERIEKIGGIQLNLEA